MTGVLLPLLIGVGFGAALERAGFGDSRTLAAQFYLRDQTVLKVMFTAVVTAMLLLLGASAAGWLEREALELNPTILGPAVLGGALLGVGFLIGGFCPGTSLVAAATGKLDGLLFAIGVAGGLFVFGHTVDGYWTWWHQAGDQGVLTLDVWLDQPVGRVAIGVVLLALLLFAGAEWLEGVLARGPREARRRWPGRLGAAGLLGAAIGLAVVGQPTVADRLRRRAALLDGRLGAREVHVAPDELLDLIYDRRLQLVILDVRSETDFNLFHLLDARRLGPADESAALRLPARAVKVLVANDEAAAELAWRRLTVQGALNVYVLSGGINGWLARFGTRARATDAVPGALRYRYEDALGERRPESRPPHDTPRRPYTRTVRIELPAARSGGCGG